MILLLPANLKMGMNHFATKISVKVYLVSVLVVIPMKFFKRFEFDYVKKPICFRVCSFIEYWHSNFSNWQWKVCIQWHLMVLLFGGNSTTDIRCRYFTHCELWLWSLWWFLFDTFNLCTIVFMLIWLYLNELFLILL